MRRIYIVTQQNLIFSFLMNIKKNVTYICTNMARSSNILTNKHAARRLGKNIFVHMSSHAPHLNPQIGIYIDTDMQRDISILI